MSLSRRANGAFDRAGGQRAGRPAKGVWSLRWRRRAAPLVRSMGVGLSAVVLTACGPGVDVAGGKNPAGSPQSEAGAIEVLELNLEPEFGVKFAVAGPAGQAMSGLTLSDLRVTLAKLIPGTNGEPDAWRSYLHVIEQADGAGVTTLHASYDRDGSLAEFAPGRYDYRFGTDIHAVEQPLRVPFEPELTHRIGIQVLTDPAVNGSHTWLPADPGSIDFLRRDIIASQACNDCHGQLGAHDRTATDTRLCVNCHTGDSADADSGNSLAFSVLMHKIHRGRDLPSVRAGGQYAIRGEAGTPSDYSTVGFPQDIRNCASCHADHGDENPQHERWARRPSRAACGSCHEDVNFVTGAGHGEGISAGNDECLICHQDGGVAGGIARAHEIPASVLARAFSARIVRVENTAPGARPRITFELRNPAAGNSPYDISSHPAWRNPQISRLNLIIGWGSADFHNTGSGAVPAQPIRLSALSSSTRNADGSFTVVSPQPLPADASGSGLVGLSGRGAGDYEGDGQSTDAVPLTSVIAYFAITDSVPAPRRQVVDIARCDSCHGRLSVHDGQYSDEPQLCVVCHNPNATDIGNRPSDGSLAADGKAQEALDFKTMIHQIHDAEHNRHPSSITDYILPPPGEPPPRPDFVIYNSAGQPRNFGAVRYPGIQGDCAACHRPGTVQLPLTSEVLATTIDTGADINDPNDDTNITRAKAVCISCHLWQGEHADTEGLASSSARWPLVDAGLDTEQCHHCHGPGSTADVEAMHPIHW